MTPCRSYTYAGARAPECVGVVVNSVQGGAPGGCPPQQCMPPVDLTTATAVSFLVLEPGGYEVTWDGVIAAGPLPPAPTKTTLTAVHTFAAGDVDKPGVYVLVPILTVPGGEVRGDPTELEVRPKFGKLPAPPAERPHRNC